MKIPPWLMKAERKFGAFMLRQLRKSIRFKVYNKPTDDFRCVFMFWHRNILLGTLHRIGSNACVVVSSSQDGELIAGPIEELGFLTARGSTTRQGSQAYRTLLKMAKERQLAITPDGPKGPSGIIQPGVAHIAYMAKIPVVAIALHTDKEWVFNSWDRFRMPKPFCTITALYSDPVYINTREELDASLETLTALFSNLESRLPK